MVLSKDFRVGFVAVMVALVTLAAAFPLEVFVMLVKGLVFLFILDVSAEIMCSQSRLAPLCEDLERCSAWIDSELDFVV